MVVGCWSKKLLNNIYESKQKAKYFAERGKVWIKRDEICLKYIIYVNLTNILWQIDKHIIYAYLTTIVLNVVIRAIINKNNYYVMNLTYIKWALMQRRVNCFTVINAAVYIKMICVTKTLHYRRNLETRLV